MQPIQRFSTLAGIVALLVGMTSCDVTRQLSVPDEPLGGLTETDPSPEGELFTLDIGGDATLFASQGGRSVLTSAQPFKQVGLMLTSPATLELEYRVQQEGTWGAWAEVPVIWSEGPLSNGLIRLDTVASRLELRSELTLKDVRVEFFTEEVARPGNYQLPPRRNTVPDLEAANAPSNLVVSRAQWGAAPASSASHCRVSHSPTHITIHHTGNTNDSRGDYYANMRGIQNYLMAVRGFCDTGYHFVVAPDGTIFQGTDERIRGEHVSYKNTNNVGISLMGNFDVQQVPAAQFNAAAKITRWVAQTYGISLDRQHVLGHKEWGTDIKSCPGANLLPRLAELVQLARGQAATGTTVNTGGYTGPYNLRSGPGTNYRVVGSIASNVSVNIVCTAQGTAVEGPYGVTRLWDNIGSGRWISDAFVYTGTSGAVAPSCR